ncbi:hypothetical protein EKO27_g8042 [Xylaria grammica]|uniref:Uncharacterized protein n=1 Tax=Xylaria grammica TaxID=363999 RepID=A0A439CXZ6_9PEZI|nr:hypothetical protein EKO27_g8042 [Xylaria grammica]
MDSTTRGGMLAAFSRGKVSRYAGAKDLLTLLRSFREAQATLEHDRIYALLGLCPEDDKSLRVSYEKPITTVISEVVSHICHYGVIRTPEPLYESISQFQADMDDLDEMVFERLLSRGYTSSLRSIFGQQGVNITMTENMIILAIGVRDIGSHVRLARDTSELDVNALIGSIYKTTEILGIILQRTESWALTEGVVLAAIQVKNSLDPIIQRFEELGDSEIEVFCIRNYMDFLNRIVQRAEQSVITEAVVLEAIFYKNWDEGYGFSILKPKEWAIPQQLALEAIRYRSQGIELRDIIIRKAETSTITERVVIAAFENIRLSREFGTALVASRNRPLRNRVPNGRFISMILEQAEISVINTHRVVSAAICQGINSIYYLDFICLRVGKLLITESEVLDTIHHTDKKGELLRFILQQAERSVVNNELVLTAAVSQPAKESTKFLGLISERFGNLLITEEILECARRVDGKENTGVREHYLLQNQLQGLQPNKIMGGGTRRLEALRATPL